MPCSLKLPRKQFSDLEYISNSVTPYFVNKRKRAKIAPSIRLSILTSCREDINWGWELLNSSSSSIKTILRECFFFYLYGDQIFVCKHGKQLTSNLVLQILKNAFCQDQFGQLCIVKAKSHSLEQDLMVILSVGAKLRCYNLVT